MDPIPFDDLRIKGELAVRSGLTFARLEGRWYRPDEVYRADSHGWPADWEGRIILGLTLLARSTHRTPAYLDEIVALLPGHLNAAGYLGPILPAGRFDEQHVSGHSWLLRGLIEYHELTGDERVGAILERMVRSFVLPLKGNISRYPIDPRTRFDDQGTWTLSKLQTKTRHHAETSDAGCCFIMLDGATHAYQRLGWPELREVVEETIARFMQLDLLGLHIQTHATLSGVRGMLRFFERTGDRSYLQMAVRVFETYKREAWSEAFGNYNWFGAPRWTEPCGIIDSFMVATQLWKHTRNPGYLEDAHRIYFNALCHGHRANGSFGTDRCVGAREAEDSLFLAPVNFETYWCCTMRGGEGWARAIQYGFFLDGADVYVPFFNDCTATLRFDDGLVRLEERTRYPYHGQASFEVLDATAGSAKRLNLFVPSWAGRGLVVRVNGESIPARCLDGFVCVERRFSRGDRIDLDLDLALRCEDVAFENSLPGLHKFSFGPVLLAHKAAATLNSTDGNRFENYAESRYRSVEEIRLPRNAQLERIGRAEFKARGSDVVLSCLCDVRDLTQEDGMRQVLFRE